MTNMHNQNSDTINATEIIANFHPCINEFIDIMERENACVKEHDTNQLVELLPFKKACNDRYEKIMDAINQLLSEKAFSREEILSIYNANNEFIRKSKENYIYLNNAHDYSQRLMDIFFNTIKQMNKYCYTNTGESKSSHFSQPIALSQTF